MSLTKEQFDKLYAGSNLAVHCDTEEKANEFLKIADEFGYKWCNGESYTDCNEWNRYDEQTCYDLESGGYADYKFFKQENYTIVAYPQHSIQFTKSDLKSGDKVVFRNNNTVYLLKEVGAFYTIIGNLHSYLIEYTNGLKDNKYSDYDIMQVYRDNILIWQRIEAPQKTPQQIEIERIEQEMREYADKQIKF